MITSHTPQMPLATSPDQLIHAHHSMVRAQYGKLKEADGLLKKVREEMDNLVDLGDSVDTQDVIKASGKLVGHGIAAPQMAEILSSMPAGGGQPLAEWLVKQDQIVRSREAQMHQVKSVMQSHLAASGLRVLAAEHLKATNAGPMAEGEGPGIQPNELTVNQSQAQPQLQGGIS